jgi:hypothetical protein
MITKYYITSLGDNLFNSLIFTAPYSSLVLKLLDLSNTLIDNIGRKACRDLGLISILFSNQLETEMIINNDAFKTNNIKSLIFPVHLYDSKSTGAFPD